VALYAGHCAETKEKRKANPSKRPRRRERIVPIVEKVKLFHGDVDTERLKQS